MSRTSVMARTVWPAMMSFLVLSAAALALGLASRAGLVSVDTSRRALGVVIGLMAIVTGNFLPKLRPLGASDGNVAAAERSAGWILVLLGITLAAMFLFGPLALARAMTPLVTLVGLGVIAYDWIWTAWSHAHEAPADEARPRAPWSKPRELTAWLLFALAYVLVVISLKFITDDTRWAKEFAMWSVVGFTGVYAIFAAVVDHKRRARP